MIRRAGWLAICVVLGCKKTEVVEGPPPVAAPVAAVPVAAVPTEQAYGDKYLVILSSSPTQGVEPPSLAILAAKPELGAKVARLDSSKLKNLMPCFEVVVARAFEALPEAKAWSAELKKLGVDHYLKNAGKYVGRQPAVDAYCEEKRSARPADACGGVRFVEKWQDALLISLGEAADAPAALKPIGGNRSVWRSPLAEKIHGAHRIGDVELVLEPGKAEPMRCTVRGFSIVVRGHPHFGYFDAPENTEPGCGSPEVFAELDCPRSIEGEVALAVAHDRPLPASYAFEGPELDESSHADAVVAAMEKTPEYRAAVEEAERAAKERGATLERAYGFRVAAFEGRRLLVVRALLTTGEGLIECGGEDVRIELVGAFEVEDQKLGALVSPFRRFELRRLGGVVDLERDGAVETFEIEPPARFTVRRADDAEACELLVPFCDCGC